MAKTEGILNSRPLTTDNISDPTSSLPLSPSDLLTMKSKIILPPPGDFLRPDLYSCRRWRRVQLIVNEFWCHWRKELLQSLQERKKLTSTKRNLKVGDIAILQEANTIMNEWQMCIETCKRTVMTKGLCKVQDCKLGVSTKQTTITL